MKKTILSLLLIGSSCMVFAQVDSTRRNNTNTYDSSRSMNNANMNGSDSTGMNNMNNMNNSMNNVNRDSSMSSTNAYNAYGTTSVNIPYRAQLNVQKDYPSANNITWTQSGDWYHGTYMNNGRYAHIYYNDRGDTYTVSMPVTQTYVPDDIMNRVTTMYGPMVYDVTMMKGDSGQSIYQVRTLENGQVKAQWIGDDGSTVMDPFRSDINTNMSSSSNAAMGNDNMDSSSMNNNMNATDSMNNWNNRNNIDSMNNMNNMNNMDSSRMNNTDSSRMNMNNTMDSTVTTDSSGNSTSGMNNKGETKMKIKTENSNGKETKVKIKNGEIKKQE